MSEFELKVFDYFWYKLDDKGKPESTGGPIITVNFNVVTTMITIDHSSDVISLDIPELTRLCNFVERYCYYPKDRMAPDPGQLVKFSKGPTKTPKLHYLHFHKGTHYLSRQEALHFVRNCHVAGCKSIW